MTTNKKTKNSLINFRMEALQNLWSQQSEFTLYGMIPFHTWGYVIFACCVSFLLLVWGIFGSVSEYVMGEGLLVAKEDSIYSISSPAGVNQLKEIKIKPGGSFQAGEVIALFENPELKAQIPILKSKVAYLQDKLKNYKDLQEKETKEREMQASEQRSIIKKIIDLEFDNIGKIQTFLSGNDALAAKGLLRNYDKRNLEQQFVEAQRNLESFNNQLISNEIALSSFKDSWIQRILQLELQEKDASYALSTAEEKLATISNVKALVSGKVINIHKSAGETTREGEPVATIVAHAQPEDTRAVIYLSGFQGKKVKPGMRALIAPTIVQKEEYGSIEGIVEEVSDFPVNPQEILSDLKNETIVKSLTSKEAPIKAIVTLKKAQGKLKWSSSNGPDYPITDGTYVTANIMVQRKAPISLLIPMFKKLVGVS
ncbi:MAG: NHLP bacteriocin system secretion protein [Alphaproteobacteria bacterium]|nr:NHLP bacteriocin system secretion protein [Alphaproteobacteria bacterium]